MTDPFLAALHKSGLKDVSVAAEGSKLLGYLPSGNFALNWILSNRFNGGWPLGHVVEIFGDPSTGKSYLIARAIAQALSNNGVALLDDTEGAFNDVWASLSLGIDTSRLAYRRSRTVKDHMETVTAYVKAFDSVSQMMKLGPSILALDSLALLTTEHEKEVGLEKPSLTRAKEFRTLFRVLGSEISRLPAVYIVANHKIANIGDMWETSTTPGGGAVKFQASIRIDLQKPSRVKQDTDIVGVKIKVFVNKTRFTAPWRSTELVIPFYEQISPYSGLIGLLLDLGVFHTPGRNLVVEPKYVPFLGIPEDTKIPAHKSDLFKQDKSGQALLEKHPDLLEKLDGIPGLGAVKFDPEKATDGTEKD